MITVEKVCPNCKKPFKSEKYRKQKFCSPACVAQYYGRKRAKDAEEKRVCKECGKTFTARRGDKTKFCSSDCARKSMIRNRDKGKRVWWKCPICHKKFYIQKSRAKRQKYCSVECQAKAASIRLRGKRNKSKIKNRREIKVYPNSKRITTGGERKALHRCLVEKEIGRELKSSEQVHHIDMDKNNDTIDNLYLYKNSSEHMTGHHTLEKLVKLLLSDGVIKFQDGKYLRCK